MSDTPLRTSATSVRTRVLVVEDSATQAAALAVLLERAGYDTVIARRAERALDLMESEAIELVLSDVVMPGVDGYELCRRIKSRPEWSHIPVVLLTSVTDPLAIVRGLAAGADHYVTKPYDPEGLLTRVRFVVQRASTVAPIHPKPVDVELLGEMFSIRATKEQILELVVSSYSDLVRTSEAVRLAEQRARFLAEATELLSSTLDARRVLSDLARLSVPRIAEFCTTEIVIGDNRHSRVAVQHALAGVAQVAVVEREVPAADVEATRTELRPRVLDHPDREVLATLTDDPAVLAALMARGPLALTSVPLVARGRALGVMHLVTSRAAHARLEEMPLVEDLARRAALAVDNALLYEEAQRATRARDDVLAIVSHDLRNPISTIQMSTSFLLDVLAEGANPADLPLVPQLMVMQRATRRADALIQDLLDVSRIDAGTLAVATSAIQASMLMRESVLELEPLVTAKKLSLVHEWSGADVLVAADRSRIGQVFSNLVGNAVKFTKAGGTVRLDGHRDGNTVHFDVIDTGMGIPAEHLPHLFDRFWQASQTSRTGAGLGLYIVKGIVAAHGGQIVVQSVAGEGTRFRFSLPTAVTRPEP